MKKITLFVLLFILASLFLPSTSPDSPLGIIKSTLKITDYTSFFIIISQYFLVSLFLSITVLLLLSNFSKKFKRELKKFKLKYFISTLVGVLCILILLDQLSLELLTSLTLIISASVSILKFSTALPDTISKLFQNEDSKMN